MSTKVQLPNGEVVKRGDAILVANGGRIMTAFIDMLGTSEGYPYVSVIIINGSRNAADAGQSNPPMLYDGAGYRHISTPPTVHGNRFSLVTDEEEAALRAYADDAADGVLGGPATPPVEVVVPDGQAAPPTTTPPAEPDPRDTDGDGQVSKAERKAWNKAHKDDPRQ